MTLCVLGINHKTASVSFREQVAFNQQTLHDAYADLLQKNLTNVMILSTCNRTELYFFQYDVTTISKWLIECLDLQQQELQQHCYHYTGHDALTHIIRVSSGLDSMILGEPQILGQLKKAFVIAKENSIITNKKFTWIIEQVFSATKIVRHDSKLGEEPVSIAFAVSKLVQQIFDKPSECTLMLVAIGEMNQLVAKHLCTQGIKKIIICNRTLATAEDFAESLKNEYHVDVHVVPFLEISNHLQHADVVCSCTASLEIVIHFSDVKQATKKRRYTPMLMVDLAVPRDIDSKVSKLDGVFDYTVDDLQEVLIENIEKRKTASVKAEVIVGNQVAEIVTKQRLKDIGFFIAQYQQKIDTMASEVYEKSLTQLSNGEDAPQVLKKLSKQLTAKIAHTQFNLFKEAAALEDTKVLDFMIATLSASHLFESQLPATQISESKPSKPK